MQWHIHLHHLTLLLQLLRHSKIPGGTAGPCKRRTLNDNASSSALPWKVGVSSCCRCVGMCRGWSGGDGGQRSSGAFRVKAWRANYKDPKMVLSFLHQGLVSTGIKLWMKFGTVHSVLLLPHILTLAIRVKSLTLPDLEAEYTCSAGNVTGTSWKASTGIWKCSTFFVCLPRGFPGGLVGKESTCNAGDLGSVPGLGRSRRREWLPPPVFLPGEFPWTEEPDGLLSMQSQRVRHDWTTKHIGVERLPGGWDDKESTCNAGDLGSIPGSGRSPGEGHGNPF